MNTVFLLEVGGNVMTQAAGLRRLARGWQGERAPCRKPRGSLPLRPGGPLGSITSRSHSGRGSASAHTPAPTALRPRSTAPRCPRPDPSRGGGPGWAPLRGHTACHPACCGGAHLARASLCWGSPSGVRRIQHMWPQKKKAGLAEYAAQI